MNIFLGVIIGLIVLTFLVTVHEFGHFIMARKAGVRVKEFGIAFPPRAICWVRSKPEKGKKKGKWTRIPKEDWQKEQDSLIFSLNWLPLGGFCAMDGESDDEIRPGTFGSVSFWKKTRILFGGVLMNWLIAFFIFTILCWTGMPIVLEHQFTIKSDERATPNSSIMVKEIEKGSPAESAGIKVNDRIISVDGMKTSITDDVIDYNEAHAGETVTYVVERSETEDSPVETIELPITLNQSGSDYLLGIKMTTPAVTRQYTWSAPVVAAGLTVQATGETFVGIGKLLVNLVTGTARQVSSNETVREEGQQQLKDAGEKVSGIVGIIGNYFPKLISSGFSAILLFSAIISISLACMNVIPIPALDGGRWLLIFLYRLRHKKLPKDKEQSIVSKSIVVLLFLIVVVTILDIIKLF